MDLADLVLGGSCDAGSALMAGWLKAPALHFMLLGALVFAIAAWQRSGVAAVHERAPALQAVSDADLLEREARRLGLERDDSGIQRRLVQNLRFLAAGASGDDCADFEEALALGLDRSDLVVRRRLVQRLELRALAWARASEPSNAELMTELEREPERFTLPERTRLSHVFLSRDRRAGELAPAERALAKRLAQLDPRSGAGLGDPFLLGNDLAPRSRAALAASFGESFAAAVAELPPGRWSGPIASSFGLHHVFVHERISARAARLPEVRAAVHEAVIAKRAEIVLADWLRRLRGVDS